MAYHIMSNYTFEERGVYFQETSRSIGEAMKRFDYSCEKCVFSCRNKDCRSCAIEEAHKKVIEKFVEMYELEGGVKNYMNNHAK